jgi:glycerate kinase
VLTGEGRIDHQTPRGKTVAGIARRTKGAGKPVIAFAGELGAGYEDIYRAGITRVVGIVPAGVGKEEAMKNAARFLAGAVEKTVKDFKSKFVS